MKRRDFVKASLGAGMLLGGPLQAAAGTPAALRPISGDLPRLVLPHSSGASVAAYLQGAHVSSWIRPGGQEVLFMSRQSLLEPGQPIRGGIPVVFPQFANLGPLPLHGVVRTLPWEVAESGTRPDGTVHAVFRRSATEATRALWPHPFLAELRVALGEDLTTSLRITNTGDQFFDFQSSLHTYLRVGDIERVTVEGVNGARYLDRTADGAERVAEPGPLRVRAQTDRVYVGAPDRLRVHDASLGRTIVVEKEGFADAVVWNPWAERAREIADIGDEEYRFFICVEPANVATRVRLEPGRTWTGTQRLRVEQT